MRAKGWPKVADGRRLHHQQLIFLESRRLQDTHSKHKHHGAEAHPLHYYHYTQKHMSLFICI